MRPLNAKAQKPQRRSSGLRACLVPLCRTHTREERTQRNQAGPKKISDLLLLNWPYGGIAFISNAELPDPRDVASRLYINRRIAVDQKQISAKSFRDVATVVEAKCARRLRSCRHQCRHRRETRSEERRVGKE